MSIQRNKRNTLRKELFIDNNFVEEMRGIKRTFHNPKKSAENPVIPYNKPWEYKAAFVDTGLVGYDEKEKIFRAWYQGGRCLGKGDHSTMCYATSKDGIRWKKPSLGIIEFEGSRENNILLYEDIMMHDPSLIFDPQDPDASKRYKATWWGGKRGKEPGESDILGHCVAFSADGIHWQPHPDNPVRLGDAEGWTLSGLEHEGGKFTAIGQIGESYGMRVVGYAQSDDFVNWGSSRLLLKSDDQDPSGTELTGLSAVDYYGNYIGMLWVIRRYPVPTREHWNEIVDWGVKNHTFHPSIAYNTGKAGKWTIHTELVFSRDKNTWQRVNRKSFIPFGPEGNWDECMALAASPLVVGDQIMFYYTGQGRQENLPGENKPTKDWPEATGLATMRLDGFVSLNVAEQEGSVVAKSFKWEGKNIMVNANASSGYIKAEVCTPDGKPISGYTQEESRLLTENNLYQNLSWKNKPDMSELEGRELKLRFLFKRCSLFSISWLR